MFFQNLRINQYKIGYLVMRIEEFIPQCSELSKMNASKQINRKVVQMLVSKINSPFLHLIKSDEMYQQCLD